MRFVTTVGGATFTITLEEDGHLRTVTIGEREMIADWLRVGSPGQADEHEAGHYSLRLGDRSYDLYVRPLPPESASRYEVSIGSATFEVGVQDERTQAIAGLAGGAHISGDAVVRAPMPGLVSTVLAQAGDHVNRGQAVVVLEAMKMENDLTTPRAGIVKSIQVKQGQAVNQGDTLVVIGDTDAAPADDDSGK